MPSWVLCWMCCFVWDLDTDFLAQFHLEAEDKQVSSLPTSENWPGCLLDICDPTLTSGGVGLPVLILSLLVVVRLWVCLFCASKSSVLDLEFPRPGFKYPRLPSLLFKCRYSVEHRCCCFCDCCPSFPSFHFCMASQTPQPEVPSPSYSETQRWVSLLFLYKWLLFR